MVDQVRHDSRAHHEYSEHESAHAENGFTLASDNSESEEKHGRDSDRDGAEQAAWVVTFDGAPPRTLLPDGEADQRRKLEAVSVSIAERFGDESAVTRAALLGKRRPFSAP